MYTWIYFTLLAATMQAVRTAGQKQLSKEFVREWLMANGFQGLEGQLMPEMPNSFVSLVTERYVELYERMTGVSFQPPQAVDPIARIQQGVERYFEELV